MRADVVARGLMDGAVPITESDDGCEFLDLILAVRVVEDLEQAIAHIQRHTSDHTEVIATGNPQHAAQFTAALRSAIADAPRGEVYDLRAAAKALEAARGLGAEVEMLSGMSKAIREVLAVAPKGELLDTSELEKQRAAIKVCPTCGREL